MTEAVQVIQTKAPAQHSVELSRNAKGEYSWSIKLYFEDAADDTVLTHINLLDQRLRSYLPKAEE